jgi:primosomal protein N' (replication factor Y)
LNYFNISLINSPLEPLTYESSTDIENGTKVRVKIKNRLVDGVVIAKCEKPSFECLEIFEILDLYFSSKQL